MKPSFIQWVQQPGWELKFGYDREGKRILIVESPSWTELSLFLDSHTDELAAAAGGLNFAAAHTRYPGCKDILGMRIPAYMHKNENSCHDTLNLPIMNQSEIPKPKILTPSVYIGLIRLGKALRPRLDYMLENPDKKIALTRKRDNAQLVLTEAAAQTMKSDGLEAVKRKTEDFWLPQDLIRLEQAYRDYGGLENGFELTYTATLDKPKSDPTAQWGQFTAHYILREDDFREVYREGELIDLVEISKSQFAIA